MGKRIGEIRHDLGNVEIKLLVKEAQGRLGHRPAGALRLEVMPETDRNAIEVAAVYGCHDPFGTRHVVDLKTTPRRLSILCLRHVKTAPAAIGRDDDRRQLLFRTTSANGLSILSVA